jgi:hypothetical protein
MLRPNKILCSLLTHYCAALYHFKICADHFFNFVLKCLDAVRVREVHQSVGMQWVNQLYLKTFSVACRTDSIFALPIRENLLKLQSATSTKFEVEKHSFRRIVPIIVNDFPKYNTSEHNTALRNKRL